MKATINGITVEGTPQEIMEYERLAKGESQQQRTVSQQELLQKGLESMPWKKTIWEIKGHKPLTATGSDSGMFPTGTNSKCLAALNGGCYCTGACK